MPTENPKIESFSVASKIPDNFSDFSMGLMALVVSRSPEITQWAIMEIQPKNQASRRIICLYFQLQKIVNSTHRSSITFQNYVGMTEVDFLNEHSNNIFNFWNNVYGAGAQTPAIETPFDPDWLNHPWKFFLQKYNLKNQPFALMSSYGTWFRSSRNT